MRRPFLPQLPGMPEDTRKAINAAIRTGSRRASPLSWSAFIIALAASIFVALNSRTILTFQENYLHQQHCEEKLSAVEAEVSELKSEVERLKQDRHASN